MIIECINCNKKFNVEESLIPDEGREIQCGSCNHVWFYKIEDKLSDKHTLNEKKDEIIEKDKYDLKPKTIEENISENESKIKEKKINKTNKPINKAKNYSLTNFFSYIIVFLISFIALIILLDTLKNPLINIFPRLENILFSLFEILRDIKLFIIDLL